MKREYRRRYGRGVGEEIERMVIGEKRGTDGVAWGEFCRELAAVGEDD